MITEPTSLNVNIDSFSSLSQKKACCYTFVLAIIASSAITLMCMPLVAYSPPELKYIGAGIGTFSLISLVLLNKKILVPKDENSSIPLPESRIKKKNEFTWETFPLSQCQKERFSLQLFKSDVPHKQLPSGILSLIFSYLPPHALEISRLVCQQWKKVIESTEMNQIWKKHCQNDFISPVMSNEYYRCYHETKTYEHQIRNHHPILKRMAMQHSAYCFQAFENRIFIFSQHEILSIEEAPSIESKKIAFGEEDISYGNLAIFAFNSNIYFCATFENNQNILISNLNRDSFTFVSNDRIFSYTISENWIVASAECGGTLQIWSWNNQIPFQEIERQKPHSIYLSGSFLFLNFSSKIEIWQKEQQFTFKKSVDHNGFSYRWYWGSDMEYGLFAATRCNYFEISDLSTCSVLISLEIPEFCNTSRAIKSSKITVNGDVRTEELLIDECFYGSLLFILTEKEKTKNGNFHSKKYTIHVYDLKQGKKIKQGKYRAEANEKIESMDVQENKIIFRVSENDYPNIELLVFHFG